MLSTVMEDALAAGVAEMRGLYFPTTKNGLVRSFYKSHGFVSFGKMSDWRIELNRGVVPECSVISSDTDRLLAVN